MKKINKVINDDCLNVLKNMEADSVDLVFTSPPYAEQRKNTYGGINEEHYVEWFLPIANEIKRVLSPTGSFFLNIKPHSDNGERSLYVFDLVCALKRELGFKFIDEFSWNKNPFPGKYSNKFKNGFEPIYHFSKSTNIKFNPLACGTPIKEDSYKRGKRKSSGSPLNGSGLRFNAKNINDLKLSRPSNVVMVNNVSNQYGFKKFHSATFPIKLVDFFIKSFSNEGDLVLDPFAGSGTTGVSAKLLNRNYIMIEKEDIELINKRLEVCL